MAEGVYILCALTCVACALLLWRGYRRSRAKLLLWSSLCFAGLTANNVLLFIDKIELPQTDLSVLRSLTGIGSLLVLLYGLIWDAE